MEAIRSYVGETHKVDREAKLSFITLIALHLTLSSIGPRDWASKSVSPLRVPFTLFYLLFSFTFLFREKLVQLAEWTATTKTSNNSPNTKSSSTSAHCFISDMLYVVVGLMSASRLHCKNKDKMRCISTWTVSHILLYAGDLGFVI